MTDKLKLRAENEEDLQVIASLTQDAILRVGDISYASKARALTLRMTRFRHEDEDMSKRVLSGLRLDGVMSVKTKGLERSDPEALAVLLSVQFKKGETTPEGDIFLVLAGGGELKVGVECIDVTLADVSEPRETDKIPLHPGEAE